MLPIARREASRGSVEGKSWGAELHAPCVAGLDQQAALGEAVPAAATLQNYPAAAAAVRPLMGTIARKIEGLVLADTPVSIPQWISEARRLRSELPAAVQEVLNSHEQAGSTDSPEDEPAMVAFEALEQDPEVYNTLWGANEFSCTGALRNWSVLERLGEISNPTPVITETTHRAIPGAEWVIFEHSAHLPQLEEPERYLQMLQDFLCRHDP